MNIGKGILFDYGTGKAVRFAVSCNLETGEYEAIQVAPDGINYACDENYKAIKYKGRAKGKLEIFPIGDTRLIGVEPVKQASPIVTPLPEQAIEQGLADYQKLYFDVWKWRGDSTRIVQDKWEDFLRDNPFLDHLVIKRRTYTT